MKKRFFVLLACIVLFMLAFYFFRPEMSAKMLPFFSGFIFSYILVRWLTHQKKQQIKSDEMTKKAGYASLALSFQVLMLTGRILGTIDYFFPFLKKYSAGEAILVMIGLGGLSVIVSSRYYSHNPEKTWL